MKHIIFEESETYPVALLIKPAYLRKAEMERHYVDRIASTIPRNEVIAFDVDYAGRKNATIGIAKEYLKTLLPILQDLKTKYIYCADAVYFKALTGETKTEPHAGYVLPCKIKGFEHFKIILGINYGQLVYNPEILSRLDLTLEALTSAYSGSYKELGADVIQYSYYPESSSDIAMALSSLHDFDELSADTETFSLHPYKAGVGTIGFSWDQHSGIAFACDYEPLAKPEGKLYGEYRPNKAVRAHLRNFFECFQGRIKWHNASFDLRTLIAVLWMQHPTDYEGLLTGLKILTRDFHDTKIIAYLATNNTAGNELGLKTLAHTHAGNYAEDVKDIRTVPLPDLLEYNLVDCLNTNYVFDTYYPKMVEDNQQDVYDNLMLPALVPVIQMELVGMPMDTEKITHAKKTLTDVGDRHFKTLMNSPIVQKFNEWLRQDKMEAANAKLKVKQHPIEHFAHEKLNPGSGQQVQVLLHDIMGLPVLDRTPTQQPATGRKEIAKLINHTNDPAQIEVLEALIGINEVSKILEAFIPHFEAAITKDSDIQWLHGSFNIGGTVSGRLSSSGPNLQQLPSGSVYGPLIKDCFISPPGWIFVGADFNGLEDRINALLTKDKNKLKVFTGITIYEVTVNGVCHRIREDDTVIYDGKSYTGEEFYEAYRSF